VGRIGGGRGVHLLLHHPERRQMNVLAQRMIIGVTTPGTVPIPLMI
jgi:hypothetical protein